MALTIQADGQDFLAGPTVSTMNQTVIDMRDEIAELEVPPWGPLVGMMLLGIPKLRAFAEIWRDDWCNEDAYRIARLHYLLCPPDAVVGLDE